MKATGFMQVEDIREAILDRFGPKLGGKNMLALERAFKEVIIKE
jgi:Pyruvate/2-oxoacid:ferredoxin oxidoreductase gamma subunit